MQKHAIWGVEFSAMTAFAALAIVALLGALFWKAISPTQVVQKEVSPVASTEVSDESAFDWQRSYLDEGAEADPTDPDGIKNIRDNVLSTLIGSYVTMKETGTYTPLQGEGVATSIGSDVRAKVSFTSYGLNDLTTVTDTSTSRLLSYRNDMRVALEPLLKNSGYELTVFAAYIDTGNKAHLDTLIAAAENYKLALGNALKVNVPKEIAAQHLNVLNALSEFHAVLTTLVANADDPFASATLLRNFNTAEQKVFYAFNALAGYLREKSAS